jgi:hypothetical protein
LRRHQCQGTQHHHAPFRVNISTTKTNNTQNRFPPNHNYTTERNAAMKTRGADGKRIKPHHKKMKNATSAGDAVKDSDNADTNFIDGASNNNGANANKTYNNVEDALNTNDVDDDVDNINIIAVEKENLGANNKNASHDKNNDNATDEADEEDDAKATDEADKSNEGNATSKGSSSLSSSSDDSDNSSNSEITVEKDNSGTNNNENASHHKDNAKDKVAVEKDNSGANKEHASHDKDNNNATDNADVEDNAKAADKADKNNEGNDSSKGSTSSPNSSDASNNCSGSNSSEHLDKNKVSPAGNLSE